MGNNSHIPAGSLLIFEGPDGVGKSTLVKHVSECLKKNGERVLPLSFPGRESGSLGELIYRLHHNPKEVGVKHIDDSSLQALHVAAHIDCIKGQILPALDEGLTVILDRFWWSTVAYGAANGVSDDFLDALVSLEEKAWAGRIPDLAFLITRNKPFRAELSSDKWLLVCENYRKLVDDQKQKYPVRVIKNDNSISKMTKTIIKLIERKNVQTSFPYGDLSGNGGSQRKSDLNYVPNSRWLPSKTTPVFDTYWRFAAERQKIFFRRIKNGVAPFSDDNILRAHKFTNCYRAADRVSQYLIKNVIYSGSQKPDEIFFRILLFKTFNKIETWETLKRSFGEISFDSFSFEKYDNVLTNEKNNKVSIYSAAYIMPSGGNKMGFSIKHKNHLKLIELMMMQELPKRICDAKSLQQVFEMLRSYPMIGDFLAFQYAIDINYSEMIDFSEMSFVVPGPGAKDGIRKCFTDFGGLSDVDLIKCMADRQEEEFCRLGIEFNDLWGRPLQLIDCQNLFCEVDKYSRVAHPEFSGLTGRTKIKQKFRPNYEPIEYFFPPKWNINQLLKET